VIDPERIGCCIPGCWRSIRNDQGFVEWICAQHWRPVSAFEKRHRAKIKRLIKRRPSNTLSRLQASSWERCRQMALDAAAGVINRADLDEFLQSI
jgi:hypothetical protein